MKVATEPHPLLLEHLTEAKFPASNNFIKHDKQSRQWCSICNAKFFYNDGCDVVIYCYDSKAEKCIKLPYRKRLCKECTWKYVERESFEDTRFLKAK